MRIKFSFIFLLCALFSIQSIAQLFKFEFDGTGACPTQNNQPEIPPVSTLTVSALTRVGSNLSCETTNDFHSSSGFSGPSIDLSDNYIELTITVASGYYINVNSVSFYVNRQGTNAPTLGRIAHDGSGTFSAYSDFQITTSTQPVNWNSFSPFSSSNGGTVKLRIYAWNPSVSSPSSGTLRLDKLTVFGSVTDVPQSGLWASTSGTNVSNTNTGSIGIGTATPHSDSKLDVNGNIFTNGKILIGTNNVSTVSSYALAVNGNAIFNKIKIKSYATWPDYVFGDNYNLPKLEYVRNFININKHLPGVPSAYEVSTNGLDVAETQEILLKKIEELTLYVLEMNDKINELEKENLKMKNLLKRKRNK